MSLDEVLRATMAYLGIGGIGVLDEADACGDGEGECPLDHLAPSDIVPEGDDIFAVLRERYEEERKEAEDDPGSSAHDDRDDGATGGDGDDVDDVAGVDEDGAFLRAPAAWWTAHVHEPRSTYVHQKGGPSIGRLQHISTWAWKATCGKHPRCICWVTPKGKSDKTMDSVRSSLMERFAFALLDDENIHFARSQQVKKTYGMNLKKR